ncbi:MAG: cation:proton antiporter family protein [Pseudomonadota bacterium]|nr:cation:proton antiporter family protein [Pseudomonadota bacterium]
MQADIVAIAIAFILGLGARFVGLPPLVGYLIGGFALYAAGMRASVTLLEFSEMGVTLLLFSIGLKLRLGTLLMPQIWGVASLHMAITVALASLFIYALGIGGLAAFAGLDLQLLILVAFALSFSSTVFAVKVLEEKGEMGSFYGRIAIGILIIQDIAAVIFLAASTGKIPSPWALLLFALIPLKPVLHKMLEKSGHGELQVLFGLTLALGGAQIFEMAGVKGDLGALILGVLLASHVRASELARQLLGFKDLFLVGFFLTIGLSGPLKLDAIWIALLLLLLLVPLKTVLFFALLSAFRVRVRTALLTSLSLANYSEFGLIVAAIAVSSGWLASEWLIIIAIALSVSFIIAAPLNTAAHSLYARFRAALARFEAPRRIAEEAILDPGDAEVIVIGMGRVGSVAYDHVRQQMGDVVLGVDIDDETVETLKDSGRRVMLGSATDPDHWARVQLDANRVKLILLAMPKYEENLFATGQLRALGYSGKIAAIAKYPDEITALQEAGVDRAYNLYAEAGAGFAEDVCDELLPQSAS